MPPPTAPELAVNAYWGRAARVAELVAEGADPTVLCTSMQTPSRRDRGDPADRYGVALHHACMYARVDCVRALLSGQNYDQLDVRRKCDGSTPLVVLCERVADPPSIYCQHAARDTLPCARLLLDAGARLDLPTTEDGMDEPSGATAVDFARAAGHDALVRLLEDAANLRYSPTAHGRFPRPARYFAASLLRLCYRVAGGILAPVWPTHVLPFLVTRTSRGGVPPAEPLPPLPNADTVWLSTKRRGDWMCLKEASFRPGDRVRVCGLERAQEHNGRIGTIVSREKDDRFSVDLAAGRKIAIRDSNLELFKRRKDDES